MFTIIRNMVKVPKVEALSNKYEKIKISKRGTKYIYFDFESYSDFLESKIKIKDFIFRTPYNIAELKPLRTCVNEYGVTINFYLIKNSNLEILLKNRYDKDFNKRTYDDILWFLNFNNVYIVNTKYLLEKFINKDKFELMNLNNSKTNIKL